MKTNPSIPTQPTVSFGDLISAIGSVSKNRAELTMAVADLLERGQVRLVQDGRPLKVRVV